MKPSDKHIPKSILKAVEQNTPFRKLDALDQLWIISESDTKEYEQLKLKNQHLQQILKADLTKSVQKENASEALHKHLDNKLFDQTKNTGRKYSRTLIAPVMASILFVSWFVLSLNGYSPQMSSKTSLSDSLNAASMFLTIGNQNVGNTYFADSGNKQLPLKINPSDFTCQYDRPLPTHRINIDHPDKRKSISFLRVNGNTSVKPKQIT